MVLRFDEYSSGAGPLVTAGPKLRPTIQTYLAPLKAYFQILLCHCSHQAKSLDFVSFLKRDDFPLSAILCVCVALSTQATGYP